MPDNINTNINAAVNKSPVSLILIVLMFFGLFLAGTGFYLLQKEKATSAALGQELEALKIKLNISEKKLEETRGRAAGLEAQLSQAQANIESLTGALAEERNAKDEALGQAEKTKMDLEKQVQLKSGLEEKLSQAEENLEKIQAQLKDIKAQKKDLEEKLKELQEQAKQQAESQSNVQLGTIEVAKPSGAAAAAGSKKPAPVVSTQIKTAPVKTKTPEPAVPAQPKTPAPAGEAAKSALSPSEGKILVVNKEYNFAVINLGSKDGVKTGNVFSIYHNNKNIGEVRVEKVHDSMSAADFVSSKMKEQIAEGDRAVKKISAMEKISDEAWGY